MNSFLRFIIFKRSTSGLNLTSSAAIFCPWVYAFISSSTVPTTFRFHSLSLYKAPLLGLKRLLINQNSKGAPLVISDNTRGLFFYYILTTAPLALTVICMAFTSAIITGNFLNIRILIRHNLPSNTPCGYCHLYISLKLFHHTMSNLEARLFRPRLTVPILPGMIRAGSLGFRIGSS